MLKGWRTYAAALLVIIPALVAAFADPAVIAAIPPRILGVIVALIGGVFAFLRTITNTPPGRSGGEKGFARPGALVFLALALLAAGAAAAQAPLTDAQIAAEVQALTPAPTGAVVAPPVVTEPPATEPPATVPPATEPPATPPATVGVKGAFEVRVGGGKMFWTATDANGINLSTSDVMGQADMYYWLSDHAALGISAYHDTIFLEPFAPQFPKSSHSLWGFDLVGVYTLKTFSPTAAPDVPSAWIRYLNDHAKKITVNTIGGVGAIKIAGANLTATYWIGLETRYWFDTNWYASVIADLRYANYLGVNKTFPETKVLVGMRF